jgi:uncharacterized protein (TIGR02996 family)
MPSEPPPPAQQQTLLRAVCERPDEDAPRLRYAEWLEATGDPNDAARAEFIRVQCQLAYIHRGNEWGKLREREEPLKSHCDRWASELPRFDGIRWDSVGFRRGFVWEIWCEDGEAFRRHAAAVFAAAPIQGVSFRRLRSLTPVVEVPEFGRIRRMILQDSRLGPDDARGLAESPNASGLTALHLSGNRFGDAGAKALAASPYLRHLDNLDLGQNGIGDEGVAALAGSPVVASLSHLGLGGNPLTSRGAAALAASPHLNRITGMTLWDCTKIGPEGKQALKARFGDAASFSD